MSEQMPTADHVPATARELLFGVPQEWQPYMRHWRLSRLSSAIHGGRFLRGEAVHLMHKAETDADQMAETR